MPQQKPPIDKREETQQVPFDEVLKRMLASPPAPHKKPAAKPAEKKPKKGSA